MNLIKASGKVLQYKLTYPEILITSGHTRNVNVQRYACRKKNWVNLKYVIYVGYRHNIRRQYSMTAWL